jgi:hypothetical protein
MRRNRMRSFTIYGENEEEYIKEYEKTKSRLSQMIFNKNEIKESLQEDEEDDLGFQKKQSFHFNNLDEEDDSDLGALNNDDDEDLIGHEYDNQENITKDNTGDKGIEILVSYLKTSIMGEIKNMDLDRNTIIFNRNKNIMSMSGNAIYDLNIRELVENILAEDGNEYIKSSEGNNNSLRDFIFQNIQSDSTLKIMVLSNNKNTKKSFMNKFFDVKDEPEEDKIYEEVDTDEPFEIRKKQIKLFNKNIGLQMFDTSDEFHESSNLITSVYYKAVSAFFIFIESTNRNVKKYLDNIYEKISKYFINRTVVIFGVNMLFKEDCTIDGENLRDYANEKDILFIPINLNNFDLKYSIINNLFNLILIKGIDHKANLNSNRKGSRDKKLGGFKNNLTNKINNESNQKKNIYDITKMNVPSSLGYKKKYRIKHINAFDLDDKNDRNSKRKLSMDI